MSSYVMWEYRITASRGKIQNSKRGRWDTCSILLDARMRLSSDVNSWKGSKYTVKSDKEFKPEYYAGSPRKDAISFRNATVVHRGITAVFSDLILLGGSLDGLPVKPGNWKTTGSDEPPWPLRAISCARTLGWWHWTSDQTDQHYDLHHRYRTGLAYQFAQRY